MDTRIAAPASSVSLVTPNDDTDLATNSRGISFAEAGDLAVLLVADSEPVVIPEGSLAAGSIHPLRVRRVLNTGTTATGIVSYS